MEREKMEQSARLAASKAEESRDQKMQGKPKLPYFDEKNDEMESYHYRFELHATIELDIDS